VSYTMSRALLLAVLSVFLDFSPTATTMGGSITYNIQNYAALQDGYTLSGTITTDGTIGTLTSADITAFSISVTGPVDYVVTSQSVGASAGVQGAVTATAAAITIAPSVVADANFLGLGTNDLALQYYHFSDDYGWYIFGANDSLPQAWNTEGAGLSLGGSTWIVATASVPEPGTVTLALIGIACLAVARRTRRHRRVALGSEQ
jgi:PEP-CTERM motif